MADINLHWLSKNANRVYPVDDRATLRSDDGEVFPTGLVTDIAVRWPRELGEYAYVSAASVTANLVTFVIAATSDLDTAGVDIAAVSVRRPAQTGLVTQLQAFRPGVAGWLTLGPLVTDPAALYRGKFTEPRQALLCPRAARSYRSPGLLGVRSSDSGTWLQGTVTLKADSPLTLTAETRVIEGRTVTAIVLALAETTGSAYPVPAAAAEMIVGAATTVFEEFAGPCGHRPESRNCLGLPPVETIGGVAPDCDGVLELAFEGCATVRSISGVCGAVVTCDIDLGTLCPRGTGADGLPSHEGLLPSELAVVLDIAESEFDTPAEPTYPDAEELPPAGVPYLLCATGDPGYDDLAEVMSGEWGYDNDASPYDPCGALNDHVDYPLGRVFLANGPGQRNLLIAADIGGSVNRLGSTDCKMLAGPAGAKHNAHAISIFNEGDRPGVHTYAAVEIDYDTQSLRIIWFDGRRFVTLASVAVLNLRLDRWYRIAWRVEPLVDPQLIRLRGSVTSVEDGSVSASVQVDTGGDILPGTGRMGIGTNRGVTRFAHMALGVI